MIEQWTFNGESVLDEKGNNVCTKANGKLIAKAPQMSALVRDLAYLLNVHDMLPAETRGKAEKAALDQARDIIMEIS